MKKKVHPVLGTVIICLALGAGYWLFNFVYRDPTEGKFKPLDDTNSFKLKSGRRLPMMAGAGAPDPKSNKSTPEAKPPEPGKKAAPSAPDAP